MPSPPTTCCSTASSRKRGARQVHGDGRVPSPTIPTASCIARATRSSRASSTRPFHDLAEDGEVERQYKRWFLRRLPGGTSIDLPMTPQLETLIRAMAAKPE
jgi:hypothetical protein